MKIQCNQVLPIDGIRLATANAKIGKKSSPAGDLLLVEIAANSYCSVVFTQNVFCAAPVVVAKQNLASQPPRYLLVNSQNANAGTGEQGIAAAISCTQKVAAVATQSTAEKISATQVLPFSTGVIGEPLPTAKIEAAIPQLFANLSADNWQAGAEAIMTTDKVAKTATVELLLSDNSKVSISGICKGAGMICPDMATMLAYIASDAKIEPQAVDALLSTAVENSFNAISVDSDTSTNDCCVFIATNRAANQTIKLNSEDYQLFATALNQLALELALMIVKDGEGATKLFKINISAGKDIAECKQLAYLLAHSPLVKTALFGEDPNWGRILAVIGRSKLKDLELAQLSFTINKLPVISAGELSAEYSESLTAKSMQQPVIELDISLNRGSSKHTVYSCDLSYDYVRINAEYRS